ncbi:FtsX-like permease family protein [Shigella boydii]
MIGTFAANSEVDGNEMLVNIEVCLASNASSGRQYYRLAFWLDEPLKVDSLSQQKLPEGSKWQDWRDCKGELFEAVRMEKNTTGLLLSLIVAVAAFNIITSLGLMVMEKQGEVAILQIKGLNSATNHDGLYGAGASAGIIGAILGVALGALLASQLNNLMPITGVLLDGAALPVAIDLYRSLLLRWWRWLSRCCPLYPSWRAAATQPAEALRHEQDRLPMRQPVQTLSGRQCANRCAAQCQFQRRRR